MTILALDLETTIKHNASPYALGNEKGIVCFSWATDKGSFAEPFLSYSSVQQLVDEADVIVGANFKFDAGWLIKAGVSFEGKQVWDVLVAEFLIQRQLKKFPSLNDCCEKYNIPLKLDVVKEQYWKQGVDTKDVPWDILSEYAAHDAAVTLQVYHKQLPLMSPAMIKLCKLMCQDLFVLQDMEMNGLLYDEQLCETKSKELDAESTKIREELAKVYPHLAINFSSGDQLSAFLYGGTIVETHKEHVGFYKSGIKKGEPKYQNVEVEHVLPRLFTPLKGTELQKEGYYETNEPVLRKLTGKHKPLLDKLLRLSKIEKLNGTYYRGLPKLNKEMNWPKAKLHGQFNQTLAVSGRLSSSKPNQQNFASELQDIFVSEFD